MFYHAKNGRLSIDGSTQDYICFGKGKKTLIMIPGLGDGLITVKGKALPFALMYRMYAKKYRVYVFSSRNELPKGFGTHDMAEDLFLAMQQLGIKSADIIGISQGGMIAQQLAIHHKEVVNKLVLTVTAARPGNEIRNAIARWSNMARHDAFTELMRDNLRFMYTPAYLKRNTWMLATAGKFGKPKSYDRFLAMADACVTHDAYAALTTITAPTLIISGGKDLVIGSDAPRELKAQIPHAQQKHYPELGHALYEEAPDFHSIVLQFLDHTND